METDTVVNNHSMNDDNWLNSSATSNKIDTSSNQINNNEAKPVPNAIESNIATFMPSDSVLTDDSPTQQTPQAPPPTATQFMDAFSDLDPLGTGKFRPYIDKKYFFQDLKNPPKKVLRDLTDRDGGFSASFPAGSAAAIGEFTQFQENSSFDATPSQNQQLQPDNSRRTSDTNDEFNAQFAPETQIFSPNNNGTHGTPPSLARPAADVFTSTFHATTTQSGNDLIVAPSKPHVKTDEQSANYAQFLVMDSDPFSPRVTKKFDVFEDDFSKKSINSFDFNFGKGSKNNDSRHNSDEATNKFGSDRRTNDSGMFNGSKREMHSKRHCSDSMSESETAPDPPPRPETHMPSDPPPLPPKKQFSDFQVKRPVRNISIGWYCGCIDFSSILIGSLLVGYCNTAPGYITNEYEP